MYDLIKFVELNDTIRKVVAQYSQTDASRIIRLYPATVRKHLEIPEDILSLGRAGHTSRKPTMPLRAYMYPNAEEIAALADDLNAELCLSDLYPRLGLTKNSPYFVVVGLMHFLKEIGYSYDDVKGLNPKYSDAYLAELLDAHEQRTKTRAQMMRELRVTSSRITQLLAKAENQRRSLERYKEMGLLPYSALHDHQ